MSLSEAIRILIKQFINSRGLPFRPHLKKLNLETLQAFTESEEGDYTKSSLAKFKQSLNID